MFQRYREIKESRKDSEDPQSGFTLIELLIVIVVLGILAAIVVFSLTGVTTQSSAAACNSDAKTVEVAVAAYNAEIGTNPTGSSQLLSTTTTGGPYLHSWPSNTAYTVTIDPGGAGTVYVSNATTTTGANFDGTTGQAICKAA